MYIYEKDSHKTPRDKRKRLSDVKNTLDGINSRLEITEEKSNELEDKIKLTIQDDTQREKWLKDKSLMSSEKV